MRAAGEGVDRVECQIQRETREAHRDDVLCVSLCGRGAVAAACVEPEDRTCRDQLDQRIQAEAEQYNRSGGNGRHDGYARLHGHPPDAQQG